MSNETNSQHDDGLEDLDLSPEEADEVHGMGSRFSRKLRFTRGGSGDIKLDKAARAVTRVFREGHKG